MSVFYSSKLNSQKIYQSYYYFGINLVENSLHIWVNVNIFWVLLASVNKLFKIHKLFLSN